MRKRGWEAMVVRLVFWETTFWISLYTNCCCQIRVSSWKFVLFGVSWNCVLFVWEKKNGEKTAKKNDRLPSYLLWVGVHNGAKSLVDGVCLTNGSSHLLCCCLWGITRNERGEIKFVFLIFVGVKDLFPTTRPGETWLAELHNFSNQTRTKQKTKNENRKPTEPPTPEL